VKNLIRFRLGLSLFRKDRGMSLVQLLRQAQHRWHGVKPDSPDWGYYSHSVAFSLQGRRVLFYLILNAYWEPLEFELPLPPNGLRGGWRRVIDTSLDSPDDFSSRTGSPPVEGTTYRAQPRSVVLLVTAGAK
jgi:glycogen operon protein